MEDSLKQQVSTLIDIKVLPKTMTDGYGAWWHVGLAGHSRNEKVREAHEELRKNLEKAPISLRKVMCSTKPFSVSS